MLAAVAVFVQPAFAADCRTTYRQFENTGQRREYRINYDRFAVNFPSLDPEELTGAVVLAADTWNEHSRSAHFVFGGSTVLDQFTLPEDKADCDALGLDYSIIVSETRRGYAGQTYGRCSENGVPTQFVLVLGTMDPWYVHWKYTVLEPSPIQHDLVSVLVHEFGHTLNLDHPANHEASVMGPLVAGTSRQRDLYQWDLECAAELSDDRALTGYVRSHSGGLFYSENAFTGTWPVSKVTNGVSKLTGYWNWSAGLQRDVCTAWTLNHSQLHTNCVYPIYKQASLGLTESTWREKETVDRLFVPTHWEYPTAYAYDSSHRVRQVISSDGFVTLTYGTLSHCAAMSTWMKCNGYLPVTTGHAIATAWDDGHERTVTVWAHQDRQSGGASRQIRVSVGSASDWILSEPDILSDRTKTPPAVACSAGAANGYDCIIAFVRATDHYNEIAVRRFAVIQGPSRYHVLPEPSARPMSYNLRTGSRVALWYEGGRFWIATRPQRLLYGDQVLEVYSSVDGITWTNETNSLGYSAVGPSAVSYWTGNNTLMTLR